MKRMEMKINKIILRAVVVILCCGLLSACGGKKEEDKLVGKWEAIDHKNEKLIFNDDDTYMYTTPNGNNASGSYKVSDNEIQITSDASGLGADLNKVSGLHEFALEGNKLSFSKLGLASTEYMKVK